MSIDSVLSLTLHFKVLFMKSNPINPGEDLQAIRHMMERSSKFLSLSGLSGVFAGLSAIAGAVVAWLFIFKSCLLNLPEDLLASATLPLLVADVSLVLVFAILGALFFSRRKARKSGQPFFTKSARHLVVQLLIPLATGGIFVLILAFRNIPELIPPVMLIFYGLALVNAGKFTFSEIRYLGLTEILLGLLAGAFLNLGLIFWVLGFGILHIIYGIVMYYRHEA
jgi:hypothetical protein